MSLRLALSAYRRLDFDFEPVSRPQRAAWRPRSRMSPALTANVVAAYGSGATTRRVASQFGVSRQTVVRQLRAHNVPVRRTEPLSPAAVQEVLRLYESGWSLARVGERFDRSASGVQRILIPAGVPRRSSSTPTSRSIVRP